MKELTLEGDIARTQARQIATLESQNERLTEENRQLRFEAGYLDDLTADRYYFTALGSPRPLQIARNWFYRHVDKVFLALSFALAIMALVMAGQRLGWW